MGQCCGRECKTAYCPHCGKQFSDPNPLAALREHLRKNVKQANQTLSHAKRHAEIDTSERAAAYAKSSEVVCAKWQSWLDAIDQVLQRDE